MFQRFPVLSCIFPAGFRGIRWPKSSTWEIVNGLHNVKLRNVAKLFAHLLINEAILLGGVRIHFEYQIIFLFFSF
jgi:hypothetical protein